MTTKTKYARTDLTAVIVVKKGAENPFREKTAVHKRVGLVLRASGKTVADVVKAGARTSTVRYLAAEGLVRLAAKAAPRAAKKAA